MTFEPLVFYSVVKRWKSIQTIRDFGAICPNGLCITKDYNICKGYKYGHCINNCNEQYLLSNKGILKQYLKLKCINKIRVNAINKFICPSQFLSEACTLNGIPTSSLNNSFDFSKLESFKKNDEETKKIYLVYGLVAKHKGIKHIIEAFIKFSKDKDVELKIIGNIAVDFQEEFYEMVNNQCKITYMGVMAYDDIIKYLEKVYAVVVPSLWLENYPNTALEGLSTKCLVLGSNRGGIPELIGDQRFIFDVLNQNDIIQKLEFSYTISDSEKRKLIDDNYHRVYYNNSLNKYYERIMRVFEEVIHG
jgi:glycosyltransferase involved in cell wall biosynthesis